jgi:adenosylcobinamide-GDP ribazoletransferase
MVDGGDAGSIESEPATGYFTELALAVSFLTILPVIGDRRASEDAVAASFDWFPIVGFMLGLALCGEDAILSYALGQVMRTVLVVLSLTVITGGVHLDGLADTADALGAGRDRERALEILRDSRIGTFGAIAIFFDLALKILALSTLAGAARYFALILAPGLARYAMVVVNRRLEYLRSGGAGSTLLVENEQWPRRKIVFMLPLIFVLAARLQGLKALIVAAAIVIAMRWFYRRWLSGVTGDLIGACGELVEIAVLVAISS